MLRVQSFNVQRQTAHFLPYLDAERAGFVLVENDVAALPVHCCLIAWRADDAFGPGDEFPEQHERPDDGAQGFEECSDDSFHGRYRKWE